MNPSSPLDSRLAAAWRHDRPTVVLHWALAVLITLLAALGWFMMAVEDDPGSRRYFDLHKTLGGVMVQLLAAHKAEQREQRKANLKHWRETCLVCTTEIGTVLDRMGIAVR